MFPQVDSEDGDRVDVDDACHQWVVFIIGLLDEEISLLLGHSEPDPAWKGSVHHGLDEGLAECVKRIVLLFDCLTKLINDVRIATISTYRTTRLLLICDGPVPQHAPQEQVVEMSREVTTLGWIMESGVFLLGNEILLEHFFVILITSLREL